MTNETRYITEDECGRRIGAAIAKDVLADDMPRTWTGLDPQDADQIPDGLDYEAVEEAARVEYLRILSEDTR
ncbi:MAG: hypothetical protein ACOC8P_00265 [Dichotomicrobium sp.]